MDGTCLFLRSANLPVVNLPLVTAVPGFRGTPTPSIAPLRRSELRGEFRNPPLAGPSMAA